MADHSADAADTVPIPKGNGRKQGIRIQGNQFVDAQFFDISFAIQYKNPDFSGLDDFGILDKRQIPIMINWLHTFAGHSDAAIRVLWHKILPQHDISFFFFRQVDAGSGRCREIKIGQREEGLTA